MNANAFSENPEKTNNTFSDSGKEPLALARDVVASLTKENRSLGRLAFELRGNRLLVSVVGFDRPGILAYLTKKFRDTDIESCFGQKMPKPGRKVQGSYFELAWTEGNQESLKKMCEEFLTDDTDFVGGERFTADRFFDLRVDILRNDKGLLYAVAKVLAKHNVNLAFFRADKVADFLVDGGFGLPGLADGHEPLAQGNPFEYQVSIVAWLELADDVDELMLQEELEKACPEGSLVTLRERPRELRLSEDN
jgi:predicted amino acid-binding ACT domain protein